MKTIYEEFIYPLCKAPLVWKVCLDEMANGFYFRSFSTRVINELPNVVCKRLKIVVVFFKDRTSSFLFERDPSLMDSIEKRSILNRLLNRLQKKFQTDAKIFT